MKRARSYAVAESLKGTDHVRPLRVRDYAMVALINGATKAAVHTDRKKAASKKACRRPVREE